MTFQKLYNINVGRGIGIRSGIILSDILLALALAAIFVAIITQSSLMSRSVFESAREKDHLIDIYEAHAEQLNDLMPYESRLLSVVPDKPFRSTTTIEARARWYGNERIQTDISIFDSKSKIDFTAIRAYPFPYPDMTAGTPLCSVDFTDPTAVGSFGKKIDNGTISPKITPITIPTDPMLTFSDVEVRGNFAYMTSDTSRPADPDIIIASIDGPDMDIYTSVNTGPGLSSLALAGNRIYASMTSRTAQLQIIRIAPSISGINVENNYKLPLPYATATPALGSAVFYDNKLVYLGTEKWDGDEFNIIDVSDPSKPVRIGGFETGSKVTAIFVRSGIAYIAASDESQLWVLDVRDPTNPTLVHSLKPSGWQRQEGSSVAVFEDGLSFGRTSGGFNIKQDMELFNWAATSTASLGFHRSADVSGGIYGIIPDRFRVYVASRSSNNEIQIFNHDLSTTTVQNFSLPTLPQTIACDRDNIYVLAATSPVIYKISFK